MLGLILETTAEKLLLAITKKHQIVSSQFEKGGKDLSKHLFPLLKNLLNEADLKIESLDYLAIGVGPGSYIGMRTGATIGNILSFTHNLPLISFYSSLAFIPSQLDGTFVYVGDAKMGESFVLRAAVKEGNILSIEPPKITKSPPPSTASKEPNLEPLTRYVYKQALYREKTALSLAYLREF